MRRENAEFYTQMIKEFNTFTEKVDKRIRTLAIFNLELLDALDK